MLCIRGKTTSPSYVPPHGLRTRTRHFRPTPPERLSKNRFPDDILRLWAARRAVARTSSPGSSELASDHPGFPSLTRNSIRPGSLPGRIFLPWLPSAGPDRAAPYLTRLARKMSTSAKLRCGSGTAEIRVAGWRDGMELRRGVGDPRVVAPRTQLDPGLLCCLALRAAQSRETLLQSLLILWRWSRRRGGRWSRSRR